jgi:cell division protein ZapA
MTEKKSVTVTIYKNEYTLKGEAEPQHIIDLAKYVDEKMTEMGHKSSAPADKIAILAAMNIADDLRRLEKKNVENLKLIEHLEKNFHDISEASDVVIKNAAAQNEEWDKVRIQLSQEKEKYQSLEHLKNQAESTNEELKRKIDTLTIEVEKLRASFNSNQNETHDLKHALEDQKKLTDDAEAEVRKLKIQLESLDTQLAEAKESLEKAQSSSTPIASENNVTVSDERLTRLVTKINSVLD